MQAEDCKKRWLVAGLGATLAAFVVLGCNSHPSNEQIQQQAAQTTQQVKDGAEKAGGEARRAAGAAEEKLNAVAAGVKQGMQGDDPEKMVDLNRASAEQLGALPGISANKARRIISGRPYSSPKDLVTKRLLTQEQFDRISGRLRAD